jgi:hypothetical protein
VAEYGVGDAPEQATVWRGAVAVKSKVANTELAAERWLMRKIQLAVAAAVENILVEIF